MRFPLRRVLLGFAAGAAAGWAAGLLRTPSAAPAGSSADSATRLPQEEFGEVAGHPPPRKATGPAIRPTPGAAHHETGDGSAEPASPPHADHVDLVEAEAEAGAEAGAEPEPAASRTVTASAAEALREGRAAATEQLTEAEDAVEAAAPEPPVKPARRRRPPAKPKG